MPVAGAGEDEEVLGLEEVVVRWGSVEGGFCVVGWGEGLGEGGRRG